MNREPILLVGAGRMGGALLKGWVAKGAAPIVVVEPAPSSDLRKLATKHAVTLVPDAVGVRPRACVVALKPQVLKAAAQDLRPIAAGGALMISIAAGIPSGFLRRQWGREARIIRAMPNTPGAIGRGITGLYAGKRARAEDQKLAEDLLSALGKTVWVDREADIDTVTAISGSGPAYVFLLTEVLAEAGVALGLSRTLATALARETVTGSGALLDADPATAADLRRAVTSPGGTTEAALQVLTAEGGLSDLMARAVAAARKRAQELGS